MRRWGCFAVVAAVLSWAVLVVPRGEAQAPPRAPEPRATISILGPTTVSVNQPLSYRVVVRTEPCCLGQVEVYVDGRRFSSWSLMGRQYRDLDRTFGPIFTTPGRHTIEVQARPYIGRGLLGQVQRSALSVLVQAVPPRPPAAGPPPPQPPGYQLTVPNVVGQPLNAAQSALARAGLRSQLGPIQPTADPNLNHKVARQSPPAGARVSPGASVFIMVYQLAAAPPRPPATPPAARPSPPPAGGVAVPNVVGRTLAEARNILSGAGLTAEPFAPIGTQDRSLSGRVASQNPAAGGQLRRGARVGVRVYCADVIVPNVVGARFASARATLAQAGLQSRIGGGLLVTRDSRQVGSVAYTTPAVGACVPRGTMVDMNQYTYRP